LNKRKKSLRHVSGILLLRRQIPLNGAQRRRERGLEIAKIWTLAVALMEFLMKERENAEATRQLYRCVNSLGLIEIETCAGSLSFLLIRF
jgi:hypothetical protein